MSFWIWPSLNGETSSAGASTREICVGRWLRHRTRGNVSICVQQLAWHRPAGRKGAWSHVASRAALTSVHQPWNVFGTSRCVMGPSSGSVSASSAAPTVAGFSSCPPRSTVIVTTIGAVCALALPGGVSPEPNPQTHKTRGARRGQFDLFGLALEHRGLSRSTTPGPSASGSSKGQISGFPDLLREL